MKGLNPKSKPTKAGRLAVRLLAALIFVMSAAGAYAQQPVSGTVKDKAGQPMAGVSVIVEGTTIGTTTNTSGTFTLNVPADATLKFSFIGMTPQQIAVGGRTQIEVTLEDDAIAMNAVVVTALGIKRDEKALGYAVQKVKADELQTVKGVDVATSLSGKVSGLMVKNPSDFAEAPTLTLRGETPLLVIDGVPYYNMTMRDIPADDIESISVLKGATASALYGARGGSGAVMVTTKRGLDKKGFSVDINSSTMFHAGFLAIPEKQNMYGRGTTGVYAWNGDRQWGQLMDGSVEIEQWNPRTKQMELRPYSAVGKDNFRNFLESGYVLNNSISATQQGELGSFRASASWMDTKGVYPNQKFDKYTFSIGGDMKYRNFSLSGNVSYNKHHTPNAGQNGYTNYDPMYSLLIWSGADWDIRDYRDYWITPGEVTNNPYTRVLDDGTIQQAGSLDNPYFIQEERIREQTRDVMNGNISMSYDIMPWLKLSVRSGLDFYVDKTEMRIAKGSLTNSGNTYGSVVGAKLGYFRTQRDTGYSTNNDFILSGDYTFGDFRVDGLFGGSIFYREAETLMAYTAGGLSQPDFFSLNNAIDGAKATSSLKKQQVNSLYGRLALSWRDMIYVEATLRNDWSSTQASTPYKSYIYPSVSGSFIASELLPKTDWLSIWKLRGSWTISKKPAEIYATNTSYKVTADTWNGMTGAAQNTTGYNIAILPSAFETFEVGTMASFFGNRLSFDVAYYQRRNFDTQKSVAVSNASGYYNNLVNTKEEITNKGWEITLGGTPVKTRDWRWDVAFNWSRYRRHYTRIDPEYSTDRPWVAVGKRADHIVLNTFQQHEETGELIHDANGLPLFNTYQSVYGYSDPDWIWGATTTLRWKNLSLSLSFDGRVGGMTQSYTETYLWIAGSHPNSTTEARYLDVTNPGTKNHLSEGLRVASGSATWDAQGNKLTDTRVFVPNDVKTTYKDYVGRVHKNNVWGGVASPLDMFRTTFLKLCEISLTYEVPAKYCRMIRSRGISVSFVGQNVFMSAKDFKYSDPDGGTENLSDPSSRYLGFNVKLSF